MHIISHWVSFLANITGLQCGPARLNKICWLPSDSKLTRKCQEFPQCPPFCSFRENSCIKAWTVIITAGEFSNTTAIQESFVMANVCIMKVWSTASLDSCFFIWLMPLFFLLLGSSIHFHQMSFLSKIFYSVSTSES